MAITTYSEIKTAVATWLARDDLANPIVDFVTLFEAAANRRLRVRQMEASADLTPASGEVALPSDYLAWRRVTWTGSTRVELEYAGPSWLQAAYPDTPAGTPKYFTIEGSTLLIRPTSTTDLEFLYYQKIPVLSDTNTTNWLLTAHPDLYLFGALTEARLFARNIDQAALWKTRRDELFEEIQMLSNKTRGAGAIRAIGQAVV